MHHCHAACTEELRDADLTYLYPCAVQLLRNLSATCQNSSSWIAHANEVPGTSRNKDPSDALNSKELTQYDWDLCGTHAYCLYCEDDDLTCNFFLKFCASRVIWALLIDYFLLFIFWNCINIR